jgi:hypothetical protein
MWRSVSVDVLIPFLGSSLSRGVNWAAVPDFELWLAGIVLKNPARDLIAGVLANHARLPRVVGYLADVLECGRAPPLASESAVRDAVLAGLSRFVASDGGRVIPELCRFDRLRALLVASRPPFAARVLELMAAIERAQPGFVVPDLALLHGVARLARFRSVWEAVLGLATGGADARGPGLALPMLIALVWAFVALMLHANSFPGGSAAFHDVPDDLFGLAVDFATRFPHAVVASDLELAIITAWLADLPFLPASALFVARTVDDLLDDFGIAVHIDPRADITWLARSPFAVFLCPCIAAATPACTTPRLLRWPRRPRPPRIPDWAFRADAMAHIRDILYFIQRLPEPLRRTGDAEFLGCFLYVIATEDDADLGKLADDRAFRQFLARNKASALPFAHMLSGRTPRASRSTRSPPASPPRGPQSRPSSTTQSREPFRTQ